MSSTPRSRSSVKRTNSPIDEWEAPLQIPDNDSRRRGIALIEEVIDELSSISARALSDSVDDDPVGVYTACGNMQLKLQQATALLQAYPRDER